MNSGQILTFAQQLHKPKPVDTSTKRKKKSALNLASKMQNALQKSVSKQSKKSNVNLTSFLSKID